MSDNWTSIKNLFLKKKKITEDDPKETKRSTEIQVLTKNFTSCKIRYKFFLEK